MRKDLRTCLKIKKSFVSKVLIKRQMKGGLQRDEGQGSQEMEATGGERGAMGGAARRKVRRKPIRMEQDGVLKLANKSRTSQ